MSSKVDPDTHVLRLWASLRDLVEEILPALQGRPGWVCVIVERGVGDVAVLQRVMGRALDEAIAHDASAILGFMSRSRAIDLTAYAPAEARALVGPSLDALEGLPILVLHRYGISCLSGAIKSPQGQQRPVPS